MIKCQLKNGYKKERKDLNKHWNLFKDKNNRNTINTFKKFDKMI